MTKSSSVLIGLVAFCFSLGCLNAATETADSALNDFFKQYLDQSFRLRPLEATQLGDHRFDNQLEDLSAKAREAWPEHNRKTLDRLRKEIDYKSLSRAAQIDFEILEHELVKNLWLEENFHPFEDDPRVYSGYINDSTYLLLAQSTLPKESNVANCIARMAVIPRIVAQARENLKNPPRAHTETAIKQNRGAIAFYQQGIFEAAGKTRQASALKAAAAPVAACLKDYQKFLETELLPKANGEWRIGKEKFARKLELTLDAGMNSEQVLSDAEAEFARVERDLYVIARQAWSRYFPGVALPPDDVEGRRSTVRQVLRAVGHEHGKPEDLTRDIRRTVADIKKFITAKDILRLPDPDRCEVVEMPEFKRGNSTAYMESPPPLDPKATGFYAVSPPPKDWDAHRVASYLEEYNSHMQQVLTIHEAYPGHYVQLEYANRNPSLIRKVLDSGVFVEGWAVYTEQTMLDQGYGGGDLVEHRLLRID